MRLLVARCEVTYTGRLSTVLPEATRLLMFKDDGSFLVHHDAGGYKPLNCIRREFRPEVIRCCEGRREASVQKGCFPRR